jgi:Tol biopolymer transport system component
MVVAAGLVVLSAVMMTAQNWNGLFEQGLQKERADGDIPGAIEIYKRIAAGSSDRSLAARAIVQLGVCYETLGQREQARTYYDQVIRDYRDQAAIVADARRRLNALVSAPPPRPSTATFTLPAGFPSTAFYPKNMAISPDGQLFVVGVSGLSLLHTQELQSGSIQEQQIAPALIAGPFAWGISAPVFSPDGRSLAFWSYSEGVIKRIPVAGGKAEDVYKPEGVFYGMSWGPGDDIVFADGRIARVPARGGKAETIVRLRNGEFAAYPQILPGGEAVLYTLMSPASGEDWNKADIVVQSLKTEVRKKIGKGTEPRYVPTGHILYARGSGLMAVPFDLKRLEVTGPETQVLRGVNRLGLYSSGMAQYSVSDSGTLIYAPGTEYETQSFDLFLINRADGNRTPLPLPPAAYETVRVSPNGRQLAYVINTLAEANIYVYDLDGGGKPLRLTQGGFNVAPVWSRDGERIFFSSNREGDQAIFSIPASGKGTPVRVTTTDDGSSHFPTSIAGQVMLFNRVTGGNHDIWAYSLEEKKWTPVVEGPALHFNGVLSPDGRWIAYMSNENGVPRVWAQPFPNNAGAQPIPVSLPSCGYPVWAPDMEELYCSVLPWGGQEGTAGAFRAIRVQRSGDTLMFSEAAAQLPGLGGFSPPVVQYVFRPGFDITPDGKQFVWGGRSGVRATAGREIKFVFNWFEELKQKSKPK